MQYFQVFSKLPAFTEEMVSRIPEHRQKIDKLLSLGRIAGYSVAMDRSSLWMIVFAADELAVMDLLSELPLNEYLNPEITPLMFHLTPDLISTPSWN
ncbi:MAG: hypothetical protein GC180_02090 [Bacteroidetes bacterium]|nr:hypothetical protein [Bacteroidota bacterium]